MSPENILIIAHSNLDKRIILPAPVSIATKFLSIKCLKMIFYHFINKESHATSLMMTIDRLYIILNVSIHRNFHQNWFINEYARKKKN